MKKQEQNKVMAISTRTHEKSLNPQKALIFRIVHVDNISWILHNGLHCGNSQHRSEDWIPIGKANLIASRAQHPIPHPNAGMLNDYVPFYFTPFSPMLLNIKSGRNSVIQRPNADIAILVSNLHKIRAMGLRFLFTDGHAYAAYTQFYDNLDDLQHIDWGILQRRDFQRDLNDPNKMDRYQAEALVYEQVPVTALQGIVCYTDAIRQRVQQQVEQRELQLQVLSKPGLYF